MNAVLAEFFARNEMTAAGAGQYASLAWSARRSNSTGRCSTRMRCGGRRCRLASTSAACRMMCSTRWWTNCARSEPVAAAAQRCRTNCAGAYIEKRSGVPLLAPSADRLRPVRQQGRCGSHHPVHERLSRRRRACRWRMMDPAGRSDRPSATSICRSRIIWCCIRASRSMSASWRSSSTQRNAIGCTGRPIASENGSATYDDGIATLRAHGEWHADHHRRAAAIHLAAVLAGIRPRI